VLPKPLGSVIAENSDYQLDLLCICELMHPLIINSLV